MVLNRDNQARTQYVQCAVFLAFAYTLVYGWLLASSDFMPYVMDNNESFSSYWHAVNLAQFDFFRSYGLTDEAYGFSAAAHPYVYTHQGNFPRLFNLLIYALGAHSIESQITVTTFTVGIAAIFMAYHFFCKIANPLFALVCCLLLITDYVVVAQWQVVTYRVWHLFFVFSSMLCVHRMIEGRRYWQVLTALNFLCLFYFEFIFVAFVSLATAFYAAWLGRRMLKKVIRFWSLQAAGGVTALFILALQLSLYLGWEDFKMDAYLTFVARNHYQDSAVLLERMQEFFDSRNIVFWYNLVDGDKFRTVAYFVASLLFFDFQIHTPFLSTLSFIGLFALLAVFGLHLKSVVANTRSDGKFAGALSLLLKPPVAGALILAALHFVYSYHRRDFGGLRGAEFAATGLALVITVALMQWSTAFRSPEQSLRRHNLAYLLAAAVLAFNLPGVIGKLSYGWLEGGRHSYFFSGFAAVFFAFAGWVGWQAWRDSVSRKRGGDVPAMPGARVFAMIFSFLAFLVLFVVLFGNDLILGAPVEGRAWFVPAGPVWFGMSVLSAAAAAFCLWRYTGVIHSAGDAKPGPGRLPAVVRVSIFVGLVAFFIAGSWLLYNPRYAPLWQDMAGQYLPGPLPAIVAALVIMLACSALLAGERVLTDLGLTAMMKGCAVFLISGMCAYTVVYILSPGYVFTGYRFRLVPFTAFHTVIVLGGVLYVLLVAAMKYLPGKGAGWAGAFSGPLLPRTVVGVSSLSVLGLLAVYWVGVQLTYVKLMPPDHYSFLNRLSEPPYAGKSFLVNTYAAPIAAKTGTWAYLNAKLTETEPVANAADYKFPFDTTYLWLADKRTNPDYARPEFFMCVSVQATSTVIEEVRRRKGLGEGNVGCEMNQLVQIARRGDGNLVYPRLEFMESDKEGPDVVGYERWAIVRLNWAK